MEGGMEMKEGKKMEGRSILRAIIKIQSTELLTKCLSAWKIPVASYTSKCNPLQQLPYKNTYSKYLQLFFWDCLQGQNYIIKHILDLLRENLGFSKTQML
jgi:hypothetical protein